VEPPAHHAHRGDGHGGRWRHGHARRERQQPYIPAVRWRGGARTSKHPKAAVWGAARQGTAATWAGTAETPLGGRRLGRHGMATACATRGFRGRAVDGGAVPGVGSMARGPVDRGRPRRAGPTRPRRRPMRDAARAGAVDPFRISLDLV
jgi:hypothetical protein